MSNKVNGIDNRIHCKRKSYVEGKNKRESKKRGRISKRKGHQKCKKIDSENFNILNHCTAKERKIIDFESYNDWSITDVEESRDTEDQEIENNDLRNCLRKKAIEIKKSFKVCTATADLVFLFADRDDLKKREVKIISQDEPSNSEWKEEDDAVLVALSLLYANERYSLRELNTYQKILNKSKRLSKFKHPKRLFARLKTLCDISNVKYLQKLCGMDAIKESNDQAKIKKMKVSCNYVRAAVLDMEDVYRYNLLKYVHCFLRPRRIKSKTRPWLSELSMREED